MNTRLSILFFFALVVLCYCHVVGAERDQGVAKRQVKNSNKAGEDRKREKLRVPKVAPIPVVSKGPHARQKAEKRPTQFSSKTKEAKGPSGHKHSPAGKQTNGHRNEQKSGKVPNWIDKKIPRGNQGKSAVKLSYQQNFLFDLICNVLRMFGLQSFLFFKDLCKSSSFATTTAGSKDTTTIQKGTSTVITTRPPLPSSSSLRTSTPTPTRSFTSSAVSSPGMQSTAPVATQTQTYSVVVSTATGPITPVPSSSTGPGTSLIPTSSTGPGTSVPTSSIGPVTSLSTSITGPVTSVSTSSSGPVTSVPTSSSTIIEATTSTTASTAVQTTTTTDPPTTASTTVQTTTITDPPTTASTTTDPTTIKTRAPFALDTDDGQTLDITCNSGYISIVSASYGSSSGCTPVDVTNFFNTMLGTLAKRFVLKASPEAMGGRCANTTNTLTGTYQCSSGSNTVTVISYGVTTTFSCPTGRIKFYNGIYASPSTSCQMTNTYPPGCNNQISCSITVSVAGILAGATNACNPDVYMYIKLFSDCSGTGK